MKIQTVIGKTESEFDNKVNQYLSDGYSLARRDIVLDGNGSLYFFYAELVAEVDRDIPEPADPVACAEAIRRLEVEDFPAIVVIDSLGNNLYETGRAEYLASQNK